MGGRLVISCFLIPRTRGRCPCWWPDTDTHCHRARFCVERRPEEFIDGGAEVSLRKRKWVGRSFVSRWMEELLRWCLAPITILAGIRWIRVLVSRSSSLANTENRKLLACLADVRWEYRDRAAVDLDHQSACKLFKMSDNNRKEELEKKKARLQAMRWRDPFCLRY